ncbi:MAPEG family protein [Alteromonas sp. 1_MG-2023]|uniref:MAPEG family protein n=1 Tax=Alteromonas sp. 1_MG-2023 TaxID=3062669 RepID=UPI0026E20B9B|nr:MAPEG family protein [Alteromonas sp. 1_MG-2023]MDO6474615.1 MAPEG family protein [Alteromonas sp. 1_MG-2023]
MFSIYAYSLAGLLVIAATVFVQNIVAAVAHRKQSSYIPGKVSDELSHDSFVFRSHRTFHNSLENIYQFTLPALICIFLGAPTTVLAALIWLYAAVRIIHMALYYAIATEKNPSPRSYFYMTGVLLTVGVYGLGLYALFTP